MKRNISALLVGMLLLTACSKFFPSQEKSIPPTSGSKSSASGTVRQGENGFPLKADFESVLLTGFSGGYELPQGFAQDWDTNATADLWEAAAPWKWENLSAAETEGTPVVALSLQGGIGDGWKLTLNDNDRATSSRDGKTEYWSMPENTSRQVLQQLEDRGKEGLCYLWPRETLEAMAGGQLTLSTMGKTYSGTPLLDEQSAEVKEQLLEALSLNDSGKEKWTFDPQGTVPQEEPKATVIGSGYTVRLYQDRVSLQWEEEALCWYESPKGLIGSLMLKAFQLGVVG